MSRQSWRSRSTLYMKTGSPPIGTFSYKTKLGGIQDYGYGIEPRLGPWPRLAAPLHIESPRYTSHRCRPAQLTAAAPALRLILAAANGDECCMRGASDPKWNGTRRARMMRGWWRQRALASFVRPGRARAPVPTQAGQAGGTFSRAAGVSWILPGIVGCTAFGSKAGTVLDFDSSPRLQQAATSDACKSLMCRSSVR
jgi:hypothetical protein